MHRLFPIIAIAYLITGCSDDGADSGLVLQAGDSARNQAAGNSKNPRWVIDIDGLPGKSGRILTAATMGLNGRYSLGRSGFTASISVMAHDPNSDMMINFTEENTRCFNNGGASVTIDGDRALLAGQVQCMPMEGGEERRDAAVTGWFELKK